MSLKETVSNKLETLFIVVTSCVVGVPDFQVDCLNFLLEQVAFVEQQNECDMAEEWAVSDFFKQFERVLHGICLVVFAKNLVVARQRSAEDDSGN